MEEGSDTQSFINVSTVRVPSNRSETLVSNAPALKTRSPSPRVVMSGEEDVRAPGVCGNQAQPACFGVSQLQIPKRPEMERLCSTCMSLGRLNSTHWEDINDFREVIVNHHHSVDALLKSAREGCHLCGLLLIAWEDNCRLDQEPGGGWVGKDGFKSIPFNDGIRLKFQRVKKTYMGAVDEVQLTILCGDSLFDYSGHLICKAMDSEHSSIP